LKKVIILHFKFKDTIMETKQIGLLTALAKKIKTERKEIAKVISSLQSAKILTKRGNFTAHYQTLKKVVTVSK